MAQMLGLPYGHAWRWIQTVGAMGQYHVTKHGRPTDYKTAGREAGHDEAQQIEALALEHGAPTSTGMSCLSLLCGHRLAAGGTQG
jgi:molybdenum-dependent DNA-binding transcriptional regulator ModE